MSILSTLNNQTLQAARVCVKKVHMAHYRDDHVTDNEADRIIETLGPETIERMVRFIKDKG
jgi:hypothetical protein